MRGGLGRNSRTCVPMKSGQIDTALVGLCPTWKPKEGKLGSVRAGVDHTA